MTATRPEHGKSRSKIVVTASLVSGTRDITIRLTHSSGDTTFTKYSSSKMAEPNVCEGSEAPVQYSGAGNLSATTLFSWVA